MDRGEFLLANRFPVETRSPRTEALPFDLRGNGFVPVSGMIRVPENPVPGGTRDGLWEGHSSMLHVTCDFCGKELRPGDDPHYVVKIEAYAAHDPAEITEADLDDDH